MASTSAGERAPNRGQHDHRALRDRGSGDPLKNRLEAARKESRASSHSTQADARMASTSRKLDRQRHQAERRSPSRDGICFPFVDRSDVRDNDIERVRFTARPHLQIPIATGSKGTRSESNAAGAALMFSKRTQTLSHDFDSVADRSHRASGLLVAERAEDTLIADNADRGEHARLCPWRAATSQPRARGTSIQPRTMFGVRVSEQLR